VTRIENSSEGVRERGATFFPIGPPNVSTFIDKVSHTFKEDLLHRFKGKYTSNMESVLVVLKIANGSDGKVSRSKTKTKTKIGKRKKALSIIEPTRNVNSPIGSWGCWRTGPFNIFSLSESPSMGQWSLMSDNYGPVFPKP
jgi:hypothetical protein